MNICKKASRLHSLDEMISKRMEVKDSYFIKNLSALATSIRLAKTVGAKISVIADYDCDGVCSGINLHLLFEEMGIEHEIIFPGRMSNGYGITKSLVEKVTSKFIITVDNGIAAIDAVKAAKDAGIFVGILDHHMPVDTGELPPADVIVDPHVEGESTFNGYCGAGLTYKLAQMLIPVSPVLKTILAFASIATVADVVPLREENRLIVKNGLITINNGEGTPALRELIRLLGITHVTESDYGFRLGPVFNAPGRLFDDGAALAYETMLSEKDGTALTMEVQKMILINDDRKEIVKKENAEAEMIIESDGLKDSKPIIICGNFHQGTVGITAGYLARKYRTPAIVLADMGDGTAKGSARSYADINLKGLLDKNKQFLLGYGGHKGAAGMSLNISSLDDFRKGMSESLGNPVFDDAVVYDEEIDFSEVEDTLKKIEPAGPFGEENRPFVFLIRNVKFLPMNGSYIVYMGKDDEHFKMLGTGGIELVGFNNADFVKEVSKVKSRKFTFSADVVGVISRSYYDGNEKVQIEVQCLEFFEPEANDVYKDFASMLSFI